MNAVTTRVTYASIVDQLGHVKAEITALTRTEEGLKKTLKGSGRSEIDGTLFRATVSESARETVDMEAVRAYFSRTPAGRRWIKAHTNVTPTTTVRVVAQVRAD